MNADTVLYKCRICNLNKNIIEFNKNGKYTRTQCKDCERNYRATRGKIYSRGLKARWLSSIQRAKNRKIDFSLTFEEYIESISQPCFYCSDYFGKVEAGIGLDRVDSSEGYLKQNVVSCCKTCNIIKHDSLSVEETIAAVQAIIKIRQANLMLLPLS
jgi:hypothetical protein